MKRFSSLIKPVGGSALALLSASAFAHVGADSGAHHDFLAGFTHPLTGLDHLAAMLAVGMWSAVTSKRVWAAPLSFAALLLLGALAAKAGVALPGVEPMIAASLLVLGLLLATRQHLPAAASALLVGGFALFHGAAHGHELTGTAALVGMVASTLLIHLAGLGLGRAMQHRSAALPRWTGSAIALVGLVSGWSLVSL
jgi:urease accessory protein